MTTTNLELLIEKILVKLDKIIELQNKQLDYKSTTEERELLTEEKPLPTPWNHNDYAVVPDDVLKNYSKTYNDIKLYPSK